MGGRPHLDSRWLAKAWLAVGFRSPPPACVAFVRTDDACSSTIVRLVPVRLGRHVVAVHDVAFKGDVSFPAPKGANRGPHTFFPA
jgi:hypothetical protein